MFLKFISEEAPGICGPDYHHMFGSVIRYSVTDHWFDYGHDMYKALDDKIYGGVEPDPIEDLFVFHGSNNPAVPRLHPDGKKHLQQQYLCFRFEINKRYLTVWTALPVYVMNDDGKTVQRYMPASK